VTVDAVFGLDAGFIDHVNTQIVIALHYSAIADFQTLEFSREHAKSFPAFNVFTRRFLVAASINGYFSAFGFKSSLNGGSLPTELFLLQLSSL
jgi:hypothetical protein